MHQKERVDAFDENKNEGEQIGTGRGGSGGDDADCWAYAPAGGRPAMDADEASSAEASDAPFPAVAAAGEVIPRPCCLRRRRGRDRSPGRTLRQAAALAAGGAPAWLSRRCGHHLGGSGGCGRGAPHLLLRTRAPRASPLPRQCRQRTADRAFKRAAACATKEGAGG